MSEHPHYSPDDEAMARVRQPLEKAWTLPPDAYTDPDCFAAEARTVFKRDWVCVARVDQLPNAGDYICADLVDQPIVITRDQDGALHALSRVCLHRAMPLAEGAGNTRRLVCPYHNWVYELDGQLRTAPMMDGAVGFDVTQCQLRRLRLETWQGFIFVNRDEKAAPLAPRLSGLEALVAGHGFATMRVVHTLEYDSPWNWKILVENFMEAYHHIGTHRDSLQPTYPARESFVEDNHDQPWAFLRMPARDGSELFAACVFPTFLFAAFDGLAVWYQLEPGAHDAMRLRIHALTSPEVAATLDGPATEAVEAQLRTVHEEDIEANLGSWRGLQATLTRQGRLSPYEKAIWQLNQLWSQRISSAPLAVST